MTRILHSGPNSRARRRSGPRQCRVISVAFGVVIVHTLFRLRRPATPSGGARGLAPVRAFVALLAICFTPVVSGASVAVVDRLIATRRTRLPCAPRARHRGSTPQAVPTGGWSHDLRRAADEDRDDAHEPRLLWLRVRDGAAPMGRRPSLRLDCSSALSKAVSGMFERGVIAPVWPAGARWPASSRRGAGPASLRPRSSSRPSSRAPCRR